MRPAVRMVGDNQPTMVFRCFRLAVDGGCLPQWPAGWTGPGIGHRIRIRSRVPEVAAGIPYMCGLLVSVRVAAGMTVFRA